MWKPDLVVSDGAGYREIVDAIAKAIEDGELRAGDRLPPLRDLAWHLKCNPTTVNRAYREAQARRLVAGEVGRGTFVLGTSPEAGLFALRAKAGQLIDLAISRPVLPNGITSMVDAVEQVSSIYPNVGDGYPDAELEIRSLQAASNWLSFRDRRLTSLSRSCRPAAPMRRWWRHSASGAARATICWSRTRRFPASGALRASCVSTSSASTATTV